MITLILVDDHNIVRDGIGKLLQNTPGIKMIGEAHSGTEAVHLVQKLSPDVVLLDFKLPDITGLEVTNRLLRIDPSINILILTGAINDLFPMRLLEAGVQGYVTKDVSKAELIRAIFSVQNGQRVITPNIARVLALAKLGQNKVANQFRELTDREMEIMMMTLRGWSAETISKQLFLSPKTVHIYRSRVYEKLEVTNEAALAGWALREKIITAEEAVCG